uniref:KH homology domain-containing protein 4-like n=1 Tax=Mastacembelus armatus TaxID=205130 RepID=A0A7N8XEF9_9TELE
KNVSLCFACFILRCLTSRWDQPAQPKQSVDVRQQSSGGNASIPLSGVVIEMAAAMAAKINAMLMAKGKLLTPPPLLMVVTEVDINDVPLNCRDLLTKGKTQEEVSGTWLYFNLLSFRQRPLYLHVQGKTQEQVNSKYHLFSMTMPL